MLRLKKVSFKISRSTKLRLRLKAQYDATIMLEEAFGKPVNHDHQQSNSTSIKTQNQSNYIVPTVINDGNVAKGSNDEEPVLNQYRLSDGLEDIMTYDQNVKISFENLIADWALKNCVTHSVLNKLHKILKSNGHPSICTDSRTLLKTPILTMSRNIPGGQYIRTFQCNI